MDTRVRTMKAYYTSDDEEILLQPQHDDSVKKASPKHDLDLESVLVFFFFFLVARSMGYIV